MCLTLTFALQKLRQPIQANTIYVISKIDLVIYALSRLILNELVAMWAVILEHDDLVHMP